VLFATSIYENIPIGKENPTRIEIEEAARQANAHNFIMQLLNKYDTVVGERGIQLNDVTSALDDANEKIVQEALDRVCKGRTTIVVAHRLTIIRNAHRIYVLHNGHVIEQGTHETLMSKEGSQYRKMMKAQQREKMENDVDEILGLPQTVEDDQKQIRT
ncbi:unnamed protein product, partial [Rotaria sp. Silwood2]